MENDHEERLHGLLDKVNKRVESLREQASALQSEKENILELLQDMQDGPTNERFSQDELDDFDYNVERLILRCLTVEVSVDTPRNEIQQDAFLKVSAIIKDLQDKLKLNPISHRSIVESHLNACLPEPLSSNINMRFQEKLLGCTAEDQKHFRKMLEKMLNHSQEQINAVTDTVEINNGSEINSDSASSEEVVAVKGLKEAVETIGDSESVKENNEKENDRNNEKEHDRNNEKDS